MKLLVIFALSLAAVACGDDGGPAPQDAAPNRDCAQEDAPPGDSQQAQCTVPGECPCFSNDECPEGTRCHAETEKMVYCEPGARGTGAPGSVCTGEDDCASALCVDGSDDQMRCSKTCEEDSECPTELPRCISLVGICARNPN